MVFEYLAPFDRFEVDTPLRIDEVHARLAAVTVKRHWFRLFSAVPGTFEGTLESDRFVLLTSAEGYQMFGFSRMRNAYRPICAGAIAPSPGGSRITVRARLPLFYLVFLAVWGIGVVAMTGDLYLESGYDADYLIFVAIASAMALAMYGSMTRTFWIMRDRFKRALEQVLS
jgi:hypothetical protein